MLGHINHNKALINIDHYRRTHLCQTSGLLIHLSSIYLDIKLPKLKCVLTFQLAFFIVNRFFSEHLKQVFNWLSQEANSYSYLWAVAKSNQQENSELFCNKDEFNKFKYIIYETALKNSGRFSCLFIIAVLKLLEDIETKRLHCSSHHRAKKWKQILVNCLLSFWASTSPGTIWFST